MKEVFKDIINYEGIYQISNYGRVKSFKFNKETILKNPKTGHGYGQVNLSKKGKVETLKVHKLVAIYFLNHVPDKYTIVIDHIDNDKMNNNVNNLQLISPRENTSKDKKGGSSKYVGVHFDAKRNKFVSMIYNNGKKKNLGRFINEIDAANAYKKALKEIEC